MKAMKKKTDEEKDPAKKSDLTLELDAFKATVLVEGKHRFATPRDAVSAITCAPVDDTGLYKMDCCLGKCNDCPPLSVNVSIDACVDRPRSPYFH